MSTPSEKELTAIVSMCWRIACHAELEGVPTGMFTEVDANGQGAYRSPRWETFRYLLSNLVPSNQQVQQTGDIQATMHEAKETWQQ